MYYRPLGKTGKNVSVISLGGMRYRPEDYKDGPEKCAEIVLRAVELGVNLFDTAPRYCDGQSEVILGHALKQLKEKPYVSTKCALWMADTATGAYDAVQKSIERIGVDKIDFYHMWCIQSMDDYQQMIAPGGLYEGLLRAKEDGLIEHICCSVHADGAGIKQIIKDGLIESVILGYNALNFAFRREGVIACHEADIGVMAMNPLGGGMIPQYGDAFSFLKETPDETIVQAALRFLLGQKEITCTLPGPADIAELEACVSAADREREMGEAVFETVAAHLKENLNTLCTSCGYCEPCPMGVPIVKMLSTYNKSLLTGNLSDISTSLAGKWCLSPADAAKCTACGLCETRCTQKLPIIERLDEIAAL